MDQTSDLPRFELDEHNCLTIFSETTTSDHFLSSAKIKELKKVIEEWEEYGY